MDAKEARKITDESFPKVIEEIKNCIMAEAQKGRSSLNSTLFWEMPDPDKARARKILQDAGFEVDASDFIRW